MAHAVSPTAMPATEKLANTLAHQVVRDIREGSLGVGDRLAPERDLISRYEVSRGTLREALRYLEIQGVITIRPGPNGGAIIAQPSGEHLRRTLGLQLEFSRATYAHMLQVRIALEPQTASLAASHISDSELAELHDSVDIMQNSLKSRDVFFAQNGRFHDLIAAASGNPLFTQLVVSLHGITDGANLGAEYPIARRNRVVAAHRRILDTLDSRDPVGAQASMLDHVQGTLHYTRKHHPELFNMTVTWDHFTSF